KFSGVSPGSWQCIKRKPALHHSVQQDSKCPAIGGPSIVRLPHKNLWCCVVFTSTPGLEKRALGGFRYTSRETQVAEGYYGTVISAPVCDFLQRLCRKIHKNVCVID